MFEIAWTIYSNSERSEQFLVKQCFFNLLLEVSHIIRTIQIQIGKIIGIHKHAGKVRKGKTFIYKHRIIRKRRNWLPKSGGASIMRRLLFCQWNVKIQLGFLIQLQFCDLFPAFAWKRFSIISINQSWLIFRCAKSNELWVRVAPWIQSWQTLLITWSWCSIRKRKI